MRRRTSPMPTRMLLASLLAALLAVGGCGSGLNTVRGKVTYKGEAAKGAVVVFHPKGGGMNAQKPSAMTGEDGSFSLGTGVKDGAPSGEYIVTITWPEEVKKPKDGRVGTEAGFTESRARLRGRSADPAKSSMTATIKGGNNNIPTFELK